MARWATVNSGIPRMIPAAKDRRFRGTPAIPAEFGAVSHPSPDTPEAPDGSVARTAIRHPLWAASRARRRSIAGVIAVTIPIALLLIPIGQAPAGFGRIAQVGPVPPVSLAGSDPVRAPLRTTSQALSAASGTSLPWVNMTSAPHPSPRWDAAAAFDSHDGYVVLFGGELGKSTYPVLSNVTWIFDGSHWKPLHPRVSPPALYGAAMSDDPADGCVVLFGGQARTGPVSAATWTFSAGTWTQLRPSVAPGGRLDGKMAYDPAEGGVVLFGGFGGGALNDTWKFSGGTWTNLSPPNAPAARYSPGLTWDPALGALVLFGGYVPLSSFFVGNDTWTFASGRWSQLNTSIAPPARGGPAIAYSDRYGAPILFGGDLGISTANDTWELVGKSWVLIGPSGPPSLRTGASLVEDRSTGLLVLFGGQFYAFHPPRGHADADTWVL